MSENDTQPVPARSAEPRVAELADRLDELEQENRALREQLAQTSAAGVGAPGGPAPAPPRRHRARAFGAVVLILLGALLAPVAVVAHWAQRMLTDTDRYVATVGPLAQDPAVRSAVADRITDAVMAQVDVEALVGGAIDAIGEQGLPPRLADALGALQQPIVNGVTSFVHDAASRVVDSDAFATVWQEANRAAHRQLVAVMRGDDGTILQIGDQGQLTVQLAGVIEAVKDELVDAGFGVAANIPEVNASFVIVETSELVRAKNAYGLAVVLGTWLPVVSLALLAAGVLLATRRMRTLTIAGLALALSMLGLGLGLWLGRVLYLDALSGTSVRLDVAETVFDQLVAYLRLSLRTVGVLGLVVALAAYLGGGSDSARGLRRGMATGVAAVRSWGDRRGVSTGPFGEWLDRYRGLVRGLLVAVAGLVVIFAASPTPALIVTVAIVTALLIGVVELLARPRRPEAS